MSSRSFNRTAYGIEMRVIQAIENKNTLLIAPLMELKYSSQTSFFKELTSFNRTAYGIEIREVNLGRVEGGNF